MSKQALRTCVFIYFILRFLQGVFISQDILDLFYSTVFIIASMPRSKKPNRHKSAKKHNGKKKGHSSSSTKGSVAGPSSTDGASASCLRTQTTAQTPNSRLSQASSAAASSDHPSSSDPLQPHSLPSRDTLAVCSPGQISSRSGDQDGNARIFVPLPCHYPKDDQETEPDPCMYDAVIPLDEANAYFNTLSNLEFTPVRNIPWVSVGIFLNRASRRYTPGECVKGYIEINAGRRMPRTSVSLLYRAMCHVETHLYQKYDPDDSLDDNFHESFQLQSNSMLLWPTTSEQAKYFEAGHHSFAFNLHLSETSPQSHDDGGRLSIEYNLVLEITFSRRSIYSEPLMKFYVMPMRIMDISLQKPVVIETELPSADRSSLIKFEVEINKPVIESVNGRLLVVIKANEMLSKEGTNLKIFPVFIQRVSIPNRRLILQRVIVDFYRDAQYELLSTRQSCSLAYHFQVPNILTSSIDLDECANNFRVLYLLMVHVWKQDAHTPTLLVKRDIEVVSPLNMGPIQVLCDQPSTDDFITQLEQTSSYPRDMSSNTTVKQEAHSTVENLEQSSEQISDNLEHDALRWSKEDKTMQVAKSLAGQASPCCSQSKGTSSQDSSKMVGTCRVSESDDSQEPQSEEEKSYFLPHMYTSLTAPILIETEQQTESGACQEICSFLFKQGHSSAMIKIALPETCETTKEDISFVFPSVSQLRLSAKTMRINECLNNKIRKSLSLAVDELAHTFVNTTSIKNSKEALKKVKRPEPEGVCQIHGGNNENSKKPTHEDRVVNRHVYLDNMTCLDIEGKRRKGENVHTCPLRKVSKKYGGQVENTPICTYVNEENDTGSEGAASHIVEAIQTEANPGQSNGAGSQRTGQTLKISSEKMEQASMVETFELSESNQGQHQALQKDEEESSSEKDALFIVVVPPILGGVGEREMEPNECEKKTNTRMVCDDQNKESKITRACLPTDTCEDNRFVNDGNMQGPEYPETVMKATKLCYFKLEKIDDSRSSGRMDVIEVGSMKKVSSQINEMNIDEGKASQESYNSVEAPSIQGRGEAVRVSVQKLSLEDTETYESKTAFDGLVKQPSLSLMHSSVNRSRCTTALDEQRFDPEKSNISEEGEIKFVGGNRSSCIQSESSSEILKPNKNIEMNPCGSGSGDQPEIIDYETSNTQIKTTDTDKSASTTVTIEMSSEGTADLVYQPVCNDSGTVVTDIGFSARLQDSGATSQENQRNKENTPSAAEALSNDMKKTKPKRARIADRFCKPSTIRRRRRSSSDKDPSNDPKSAGNTHSTAGTSTSSAANTCESQSNGQNTSKSGQGKVMSRDNRLKGKAWSSTKSNGCEFKPVQYLILISDNTNVKYSLHSGPSINKDIGKIASKPESGVKNEHVSSKCEGGSATISEIAKRVLTSNPIDDCTLPCDKKAIQNKPKISNEQEQRENNAGSLQAGRELDSSTESMTASDDFTTGRQHSACSGHSIGNINEKESKDAFKQVYEVKNDTNSVKIEEHTNQPNTIVTVSIPQVNKSISSANIPSLHTYKPNTFASELDPDRYSQMDKCDRRKIKKQFEGITYYNQATVVSKTLSASTDNLSSLSLGRDNSECCQMEDLFNNWRFDGHHDLGAFSISSVNLYSNDPPTGDKKCSNKKDHVNCMQYVDKGMHRDLFKANETFFDLQARPDELRARTQSPAQGTSHRTSHRAVSPDYFDKCLAPQYEQLASEQKYEIKLLFEGATNDGKSNTEGQIARKHNFTKTLSTPNTIVNGLFHLVNSHQHINESHVSRTGINVSKLPSDRFDIDVKEHLYTSANRQYFPVHTNGPITPNTTHVGKIHGELVVASNLNQSCKNKKHRANQHLQSNGTNSSHGYFYGNYLPVQRSSDYDRIMSDQKSRIPFGDKSKTNARLKYDGNGKTSKMNYMNIRGINVSANNPSTNDRNAERQRREQIDTDEYESLQTKKQCYTARINEINVELHTYQWRDDKYERLKMLQEEVKFIDKTLDEIRKRNSHIGGVAMAKKHQRTFPVIGRNEMLVPASRALSVQDKQETKLNVIRRQKPQDVKYCQDSNKSGQKMFVELWTGIRRSRPGSSESISSINSCNVDKQRFHLKQPQQRRGLRIH